MKLTATELANVRARGFYITENCDGCGKLLNQSVRYTIRGRLEVSCSAACRDIAFFGDRLEAKKHMSPGRCAYCGAILTGKRRDALYCEAKCRMRAKRTAPRMTTAGVVGSRTAT